MVGEDGGLDRRRASRDGGGEGGDDGVARAGHVEDFLRDGRDVERLFVAAAEEQSLLAQRDQEQRGREVAEDLLRDAHESGVFQRVLGAFVVGHTGQLEGFLAVRREQRQAGDVDLVDRLRIEADPDAARFGQRLQFVQQRLGDDAFAVVADDDGVGLGQRGLDGGEQAGCFLEREVGAGLAVEPDDLLLLRDDARLDRGVAAGDGEEALGTDGLFGEKLAELVRGLVFAHGAEEFHRRLQLGEIAGHVGRTAGHVALALEIDDGHGRFGRNARDASPDELVQHHVADDEDARGGELLQQVFDAVQGQSRMAHVKILGEGFSIHGGG